MPKQTNKAKALIALLNTNSIRDAAKAVRLSEETLYRYLRESDFLQEYREARRQTVENAVSSLQRSASEAAETLRRNLHCENPAVEVRTAQIILENAVKGVELIDIIERLENLESEYQEKTKAAGK